jgi:hypothetical protein
MKGFCKKNNAKPQTKRYWECLDRVPAQVRGSAHVHRKINKL